MEGYISEMVQDRR